MSKTIIITEEQFEMLKKAILDIEKNKNTSKEVLNGKKEIPKEKKLLLDNNENGGIE